jgi:hypothetical protein
VKIGETITLESCLFITGYVVFNSFAPEQL